MKKEIIAPCVDMRKTIKISRFIIIASIAALLILPMTGSAWVYDVRQNFPLHLQGDNGIFLQYRNGSDYVDLINDNPFGEPRPVNPLDYVFVNPDLTDQDHYPVILGYPYNDPVPSLNQISAAPSCTPRNNIDADAVMRITIPDNGGQVQITGSCGSDTQGNVYFTIYKGAGNYNSPVWSTWNSGTINITIPYSRGDQLLFATNSGADGCPDLSYWKDLKLKLNVTDATTQIGIFRPSTGSWFFDTTKTGVVNKSFLFGKSADIPVVGDWNGDDTTDAGVFRPSNGYWYLDTSKNGTAYIAVKFGKSGDIPVVGDWNGDKVSDIGVFRPATGAWYLDTTKTGVVNKSFQFGKDGDMAVVGKWT